MDESFIFTLMEGLPRQGPGSNDCTKKAFSLVSIPKEGAKILDIGCGSGMQTIALAKLAPSAHITAVDIHQPFLDDLLQRALDAGVADRIRTLHAPMDNLPLPECSFDLIWAEGSVFIIGMKAGLSSWRRYLKDGGYLAITESVWFTPSPSPEVVAFWNDAYPVITTAQKNEEMIRLAGYTLASSFPLPDRTWIDDYYVPLARRIEEIEPRSHNIPGSAEILECTRSEIAIFEKYRGEYGYQFFIMKKEG